MQTKTILILFFLAVAIRIIYFFFIPLGSSPDEHTRFGRIYYTAIKIRFPEKVQFHISNHTLFYSPLYFWIAGLFLSPFLKLPLLPTWQALQVYGLQLKLLSLFFSITSLIATLYLIKKLYPQLLLYSSLILFFFPQWTSSAVWIGMDHFFLLLTAIILIVSISKLLRTYNHKSPILLGVLTGLSILTKPFGFSIMIGILVGILASRKWESRKLLAATIYILTTLFVPSFWFWTNWQFTGDPLSISSSIAFAKDFTQPFSFPFYPLGVAWWTLETFIGSWGPTNNIRLPFIVYLSIALAIVILLLIKIRDKKTQLQLIGTKNQKLFMIILFAMFLGSFIQFLYINTFISFQPQGRYFYPLFLLFPILLAVAIKRLIHPRGEQSHTPGVEESWLTWLVAASLLFLNFWGLHCVSSYFYKKSIFPTDLGCVYHRVRLPEWKEPLKFK